MATFNTRNAARLEALSSHWHSTRSTLVRLVYRRRAPKQWNGSRKASALSKKVISSPALCQPKVMAPPWGLEEIHSEKMLIRMLPKSVRRCAASVMMARLWAAYPPGGFTQSSEWKLLKKKKKMELFRATFEPGIIGWSDSPSPTPNTECQAGRSDESSH